MINEFIEKEIDKVAQRSPLGVLTVGAMKEFAQTIAKEVAMKFTEALATNELPFYSGTSPFFAYKWRVAENRDLANQIINEVSE